MKSVFLLFAASIFCGDGIPKLYSQTNDSKRLVLTGHRGAAGFCPENTLSSIKKAIALNVDRIEVDVHQTMDNVIVLMHDKTLDRTTTGKGRIKDHTYKHLLQYNIEDTINGRAFKEKIPTLEEAVKIIPKEVLLVIEIKEGRDYYPGIEKNILGIIKSMNFEKKCIIQSFKDEILLKIHTLNPSVRLHKLLLNSMFYDLAKLPFVEEFSVNYYFTTKKLVGRIHAINKKINVWTVNDQEKVEKLIRMNVDGIITDFPNIGRH